MALFYQSGRVNRFSVGVPGFSTETDLVLNVDGAIGVSTLKPRGAIDTPEISIRGDIIDSAQETGAIGYFLTQDVEGVRWIAASPSDLTFIRVFENGVLAPGFSSVSGLNFISQDEYFLEVDQNPGDPNLADIKFNNPWIKTGYAYTDGDTYTNFGLSTSFGEDGTFWSLPGYGTSTASGITSVGVGTAQPQADLQVGIGSTGVQIYGEEGLVEAETIRSKNLEVEGNITVESLVVDPGIATFRGDIDAQGVSTFVNANIGLASITVGYADTLFVDELTAGITRLGVGVGSTSYTIVENNLEVQGGIGTFAEDLYVGNNFFVGGELFVDQLNADNAIITGIATINNIDGNVGVFTGVQAGIATLGQVGFNTGIGTALTVERSVIGLATITDALIGVSTIGFASITDAFVGGAVTVTRIDVEEIDIDRAGVGVLTVGLGFSETDPTFFRTGVGTIVGFTTVTGDLFIDGDLTVTEQFTVKDLGAENLEVTGIGTIVNLKSDVGIVTTLFTEGQINTGVSTFLSIITEEISAVSGDIGGVDFEGGGDISGTDLEFETGRIGILTGNILDYNIGIFTYLSAGVGTISTITGTNLSYSDFSTINGVSFANTEVTIQQSLKVIDQNGFGIELGDVSDPRTGLTTVAGDLYVGNDLFVQGELNFRQLNGENLFLSGIATVNNLDLNSGIATALDVDYLQVGLGTITNLLSTASTITALDARNAAISTDPGKFPEVPGQLFADSSFIEFAVATNEQIQEKLTVGFVDEGEIKVNGVLNVSGLSTFSDNVDVNADLDVSGLTSTRDLFVSGIATINLLDVDQIEADAINTGIATVRDLTVTGVTTFQGEVTIEDIIFINQEVTGVSTVTNQVVTGIATINDARIGVASIGVATITTADITDATVDFADIVDAEVGVASITYAEVGSGSTTERALNVTGVSTFTGFTTFSGDVFVDGDFTVTGITSFSQLDAAQSQIGILTVFTRADFNGITDIENAVISDSFQSIAGVSTLGFTTITDSLHIDNNLYVGGITTFDGVVNIEETSFVNQEVTGISTVNQLFFNIGVGTQLDVGILTANTLEVTGVSTFNDNITVIGDIDAGLGTIFARDLDVSGQADINSVDIGIATVGFASITNELVGVSTINVSDINDLTVGLASVTNLISSTSTFNGPSFFNGNLDIQANVELNGFLRVNDTFTTGVSTVNVADIFQLEADEADITDAFISTSRIGFSSIGYLQVGFGSTDQGSFSRTGVGTIVGFTTITGDLFLDGDLTVTGVVSFAQLDAAQSRIGILTVTELLSATGDILQEGTGIATFTTINANVGVVTSLTVENLDVTGIATIPQLEVDDLLVKRNLQVNGISTLGTAGPLGFTTTLGDLYVGGDLFVQDDIFYDEIVGRNLDISGIGTINDLRSGIGSITTLTGDDLTYNTGDIRSLTSVESNLANIVSSAATITNLYVSGEAYFTGVTTVTENIDLEKDVNIGANVSIGNDLDVGGLLQGADIFLSGAIAGVGASFTNGAIDNIQSIDIVTNTLNVGVAATFNELEAARIEVSTLIADDITTANIANSGLTTTNDLTVYANTNLEDLFVNGTTNLQGEVTIGADLTINGNIDVSSGIVTVFDLEVGNNLNVNGITTTTGLNVSGGDFYVQGISTFQDGLNVENTLNAFDIVANSGIITTFNSEDLTSDAVSVNERLLVSGTTTFVGIVTANDVDIDGTANIQVLNAGFATVTTAEIDTAYVENLSFNSGIGTDLTLKTAGITTATITEASVTAADIIELSVGVATVTTRLDYDDVVTTEALRLDTFATTQVVLLSLPAPLRSAEFTITAEDASDVHSTKIHLVRKGTNLFFNEYSNVTSGPDLGVYDIVDNGGLTELLVTPTSTTLTRFTVYSVAHK